MSKIKIIHEPTTAEPFIVLEKCAGLPSAPLTALEADSALSEAIKLFPQIKVIHSKKEIEYGLLHRLDTATRGLLLVAAEQNFYDYILQVQRQGKFIKTYFAECNCDAENAKKLGGFPNASFMPNSFEMQNVSEVVSYFRAYGKGRREVRPVVQNSNASALKKTGAKKLYTTKINSIKKNGVFASAECSIMQGFRHQVRCHLAWCGFPIINDALYNYNFRTSMMPKCFATIDGFPMRFFATGLQFPDLYSDKVFKFELD